MRIRLCTSTVEPGAADSMATDREAFVLRFIPRIDAALIVQPWFKFRGFVGEDRKCRNAVFAIVLELIVTPNHAEIGLKLVEGAARHAKTVDHRLTVRVGMGLPIIGAPLTAHRLRPDGCRAQPTSGDAAMLASLSGRPGLPRRLRQPQL